MIPSDNSLSLCRLAMCVGLLVSAHLKAAVIDAEVNSANANTTFLIDLPTVLRLAGAQNLDVQIARERLNEAKANRRSAVEQFLPWLSPGVAYHRRDGMAQAVPAGTVSETHFESYAPGASIAAQLNFGDAIYLSLAARQMVEASNQSLAVQQLDSMFASAQSYFDLLKAKAGADVLKEAINISENYEKQLHEAAAAGIAFKGDELRVRTQTQNYRIAFTQAIEKQRAESANLAQILHLDATVELVPQNPDIVPLTLFPIDIALDSVVQQALSARPELKRSSALMNAARETKKGAVYGPLIPSLGAQVFAGGFGGGHDGGPSNFGNSEDYQVTLGWRIGPGGLFDFGRIDASKARMAAIQLEDSKLRDFVIAQVVTIHNRIQSLADQMKLAEGKLATATETLRLTRERKQFGVGVVLEDIQAQQELTKARSDYVAAVAEFNKAEYALRRSLGPNIDAKNSAGLLQLQVR